jgi:hypothetical protein
MNASVATVSVNRREIAAEGSLASLTLTLKVCSKTATMNKNHET